MKMEKLSRKCSSDTIWLISKIWIYIAKIGKKKMRIENLNLTNWIIFMRENFIYWLFWFWKIFHSLKWNFQMSTRIDFQRDSFQYWLVGVLRSWWSYIREIVFPIDLGFFHSSYLILSLALKHWLEPFRWLSDFWKRNQLWLENVTDLIFRFPAHKFVIFVYPFSRILFPLIKKVTVQQFCLHLTLL